MVANWEKSLKIWDHSHNLPKGRFKLFETKEWNIDTRCRDCHRALDREDFKKIKNFRDLKKIMTNRLKYAPQEYNKFVTGLKEVGCNDYKYVDL